MPNPKHGIPVVALLPLVFGGCDGGDLERGPGVSAGGTPSQTSTVGDVERARARSWAARACEGWQRCSPEEFAEVHTGLTACTGELYDALIEELRGYDPTCQALVLDLYGCLGDIIAECNPDYTLCDPAYDAAEDAGCIDLYHYADYGDAYADVVDGDGTDDAR